MTKPNDTTRRSFLSTAAALAASVAVVTVPAAALAGDPIYAAIEVHKAAVATVRRALDRHTALERELPAAKRRSSVTANGEEIVATDDPRWIASEREVFSVFDAETDAACTLVDIIPATMAGVIALLQYANAADADGHGFPSDLYADDADAAAGKSFATRTWQHFLIANLSEALPALVSA